MSAIALDVLTQALGSLGSLESRGRELADAFPPPGAPTWSRSETPGIQIKLRSDWRAERDIPPITRDLVRSMAFGSNELSRPAAQVTDVPLVQVPWRRRQMREVS